MPIAGPPLDGPISLPRILKRGLDTKPDADALVSRRRRWTCRNLDLVSTRRAGDYLDLGLAPGDRIASLMPILSPANLRFRLLRAVHVRRDGACANGSRILG